MDVFKVAKPKTRITVDETVLSLLGYFVGVSYILSRMVLRSFTESGRDIIGVA
jgi:hypothetical protein